MNELSDVTHKRQCSRQRQRQQGLKRYGQGQQYRKRLTGWKKNARTYDQKPQIVVQKKIWRCFDPAGIQNRYFCDTKDFTTLFSKILSVQINWLCLPLFIGFFIDLNLAVGSTKIWPLMPSFTHTYTNRTSAFYRGKLAGKDTDPAHTIHTHIYK